MKARYKKTERGLYETSIWDGTYTSVGKKHYRHLTDKTASGLQEKVYALEEAVKNQDKTASCHFYFQEYAYKWLEISKASKEINTRNMYENIIKNHLAFLQTVKLEDIRHIHFQQAINNQLEHPRICKQISITFNQIIRMAVKDRLLPHNAIEDICGDISMPRYKAPEKRPLTDAEKEAVKNFDTDLRKKAFVYILYYCGLRKEEALGLTAKDITDSISISRVVVFDHGKPILKDYPKSHHSVRSVPIPTQGREVIKEYASSCEGFLFHSKNTELMTSSGYKRMWDSIINNLNVALGYNPNAKKNKGEKPITDLTAHIFRHNYCTNLCYQIPNISVKKVAQLMGDTEKVVLETYNHLVEEKENVTDAINAALNL